MTYINFQFEKFTQAVLWFSLINLRFEMMQNLSPVINCKRQIVLKSIVTDPLKIDLAVEIKQAMDAVNSQIMQLNGVIKQFKEKGRDVAPLEEEMKKAYVQHKLFETRLNDLKKLKNGDLYTMGTFEAYSPLKTGDDIRDKLGSAEVICKDYIVQEINTASLIKKTKK